MGTLESYLVLILISCDTKKTDCTERDWPCSGAEALYSDVPNTPGGHSPHGTQPHNMQGPWRSSRTPAPAPASLTPLRSEPSASSMDQSSASPLLAMSELQGRMQMPMFTPRLVLSDQGPSPFVSFWTERILSLLLQEWHVSLTWPPHIPWIPHWPSCWARLQSSRSMCWTQSTWGERM